MNWIRRRLDLHTERENGLTLIEVVVAMTLFMIISVTVLYTMMSILTWTRDSRSRQVAANLAAQEVDLARDINDVFNIDTVLRDPDPATTNGDQFHVVRTASWVAAGGTVTSCGTGGGILRYKEVHVSVTWDSMRVGAPPVVSDTLINPNERINDPTLGTIIVSVLTANGEGVEGVTVSAAPSSGSALGNEVTDPQGCAYFLLVPPNSYTVAVTAPAGHTYVDITGNPAPTGPATVTAGAAASVLFTYDEAGTFRATYDVATDIVPMNLPTSLISTRDPVVTTATVASNPRLITVSPWTDGYTVLAGDTVGCAASDPGLWDPYGAKLDGVRPEPVAVTATSTVNITVPAGAATVTGMATSGTTNRYLVAVSNSNPGNGQPACLTTQTLRFAAATSSSMNISLPYGSWTLYRWNATTGTPTSGTKVTSGVTPGTGGTFSSNVLTLDPRP